MQIILLRPAREKQNETPTFANVRVRMFGPGGPVTLGSLAIGSYLRATELRPSGYYKKDSPNRLFRRDATASMPSPHAGTLHL